MTEIPSHSRHYKILDTVRGLAALWVFVAHSFFPAGINWHIPVLTDGRAAVDVFMILSGFLIFDRYAKTEGAASWCKYFVARAFRICPLYYFLLVGTVFFLLPPGTDAVSWFINRITFFFGFVPSLINPGPLPDWSLALEMQFYLSFPLLVLLGSRFGWIFLVTLSTALSIAFYLGFSVYAVNPPGPLGNFPYTTILFSKLPMFLLGAFIALGRTLPRARVILLQAINFVGIAFPALYNIGFKSSICIYLLTLLVCYGPSWTGLSKTNIYQMALAFATHRVFCFLGDISYAVYLFHAFAFHLLEYIFGKISFLATLDHVPRYLLFFSASAIIVIPCSYLLHIFIEKPGIRFGKILTRSRLFAHQ